MHGGVQDKTAPQAEDDEDGKGSHEQNKEPDRVFADARRAEQVPRAADDHDSQRPEITAPACGERREEFAQVENEDGRIERHIEDAGGEREPALLIAPEGPEGAADPDVESALGGDGRSQLSDHESGGQAPNQRQDKQDKDGPAEARAAEDVLNAVRTAGDHEESGGDQRKQTHLLPRGFKNKAHTCESTWARWVREAKAPPGCGSSGIMQSETGEMAEWLKAAVC